MDGSSQGVGVRPFVDADSAWGSQSPPPRTPQPTLGWADAPVLCDQKLLEIPGGLTILARWGGALVNNVGDRCSGAATPSERAAPSLAVKSRGR